MLIPYQRECVKYEMLMKILHVITGMQKAAGTTTFVKNVVDGLQSSGLDAMVVMSPDELERCDIMHIHGLWSGLLHKAARFAKKKSIPIVWSTHGMTAPWAMHHKWWKKTPAWFLYQRSDLKSAALIHCTTEFEVEWNKALGFKNCFIAPLGTQLPQLHPQTPTHNSNSTLLFVGRIYPVKGLINLIKAWSIVNSQLITYNSQLSTGNWRLRIVGPDQAGHKAALEALVRELALCGSVEFAGPKYGAELTAEYDNCDCLVLPSFTENFGATIVDALAHGKTCIASTFTPWRELQDYGCGWWVSNEPAKLAKAIQEMINASDENRREMGFRGRKLVEEKYTWDAVVTTMVKGYEEVLNGRA